MRGQDIILHALLIYYVLHHFVFDKVIDFNLLQTIFGSGLLLRKHLVGKVTRDF